MPSMSYRMFQNTEIEMDQLLEEMRLAESVKDLDLSKYDMESFNNLYNMCQIYRRHWERLTSMEDE